eukprot:3937658-Rhodomonas_salina.2
MTRMLAASQDTLIRVRGGGAHVILLPKPLQNVARVSPAHDIAGACVRQRRTTPFRNVQGSKKPQNAQKKPPFQGTRTHFLRTICTQETTIAAPPPCAASRHARAHLVQEHAASPRSALERAEEGAEELAVRVPERAREGGGARGGAGVEQQDPRQAFRRR